MGLLDFIRRLGKTASSADPSPAPKSSVSHDLPVKFEESSSNSDEEIPKARLIGLPQLHGLSIGQVILLNWLNGKNEEEHVPGYFSFQYGINAVQERKKMISTGLVQIASPEKALNALKIVDLKNILRDNGKTLSGRKTDLVQRIAAQITTDKYVSLVPKVLEPSSFGAEIISNGGLVIWASKQQLNFPIEEFIQFLPADPPFEKYGVSLAHAHFMRLLAQRDYLQAAMNARSAQRWSDTLKDDSSEMFYFLSSIVISFITGESNMGMRDNYYFDLPNEATSGLFQSEVLDMLQRKKLTGSALEAAAKQYIVEVQPFFPQFLQLSVKEIQAIIDESADLSPHDLWILQTNFMRKRIPANHLTEPYHFEM